MQLIHWNSDEFPTYEEALGCKDGVVITSIFVQVSLFCISYNLTVAFTFKISHFQVTYISFHVQIGRENHGFNSFLEFLEDIHFMVGILRENFIQFLFNSSKLISCAPRQF